MYLQGTCPLTHNRALPEPILTGRQEKGAVAPFLHKQDDPGTLCQVTFAAYSSFAPLFHGSPDNSSAPLYRWLILKIQDCLLSKKDEKLPFSGHIVGTFQHINFIQNFISSMLMWPEKVIIGNPESKVIVGTVDVIKAVCRSVRNLVCTV